MGSMGECDVVCSLRPAVPETIRTQLHWPGHEQLWGRKRRGESHQGGAEGGVLGWYLNSGDHVRLVKKRAQSVLDEAEFLGTSYSLWPTINIHLAIDMGDVALHGVERDKQLVGDSLIRHARNDQCKNLKFPRTQRVDEACLQLFVIIIGFRFIVSKCGNQSLGICCVF